MLQKRSKNATVAKMLQNCGWLFYKCVTCGIMRGMKLLDYCREGRRYAALAREIGVSPAFVWNIANGRKPAPAYRCLDIERATLGAVTRKELRPDDWHMIWPEVAGAVGARKQKGVKDVAEKNSRV